VYAVVAVPFAGYEAIVYGVNACGTSGVGSRYIPADPVCAGPLSVPENPVLSASPNPFGERTTLSYQLPEKSRTFVYKLPTLWAELWRC
jgi:hypothetical protein